MKQEQEFIRRYIRVGRERRDLPEEVSKYLCSKSLYCSHEERRVSGGKDGDLGVERAELRVYACFNGPPLQAYTVTDDDVNGFCVTMTVLLPKSDQPAEQEIIEEVLNFLDSKDFVSSHVSFTNRTASFHSFGDFLDTWYNPQPFEPFARS